MALPHKHSKLRFRENYMTLRTPARRVHTSVNAVIDSGSLCSEEFEHGTHESVRHKWAE